MQTVHRSLETISSMFSVFEKDQVLTHDQLNSVSDYLEDQDRLNRLYLTGAGVVAGLRPSLSGQQVQISKGLALTTDGDLLVLSKNAVFDRFRLYGVNAPEYAPFHPGGNALTLYELVAVGESVVDALPLSQFASTAGDPLSSFVVVFYMESYLKDDDICSGTDCDNLGKEAMHTPRILLVANSEAAGLLPDVATADKLADTLLPIAIPRVKLGTSINTTAQFATPYRNACNTLHNSIVQTLDLALQHGSPLFAEVISAASVNGAKSNLNALKQAFSNRHIGIQYYYSALTDIAAAWNEFQRALIGHRQWLCPDSMTFAKHVLLGELVSNDEPVLRTPYYPSPAQDHDGQRQHLSFLLKRTLLLAQHADVPNTLSNIACTPECHQQSAVGERAVPHYFRAAAQPEIFRHWNYALFQKDRGLENYGYSAASLGASGPSANPLNFFIDQFGHFRIEGHIGKSAATTYASLKQLFANENLPVALQAVMLTVDHKNLFIKPKWQFSDLHRFHQVLRQDLVFQMDDVQKFSKTFKANVVDSVDRSLIVDSPNSSEAVRLKDTANTMDNQLVENTAVLKESLSKKYIDFREQQSWRSDLNKTMSVAGDYKFQLSNVVKTEFVTPFDSLISSPHIQWLDWVDLLIKDKDEKREKKATFPGFVKRNPGLSHTGGGPRGGTFVVVYDTSGVIVGDLSLPYWLEEDEDDAMDEPTLPRPNIKPGLVIDKGISLLPPRTKVVKDWFKVDIEPDWTTKLNQHVGYFDVFKNSITTMGEVFTNLEKRTIDIKNVKPSVSNQALDLLLKEQQVKAEKIELMRNQMLDVDMPDDKRTNLKEGIKKAEAELAKSLEETTRFVAANNLDLTAGGDGQKAMTMVKTQSSSLVDSTAIKNFNSGVDKLGREFSGNASFGKVFGVLKI